MNFFTAHLRHMGESYFKHLCMAFLFGICLVLAGAACLLHGIFPFILENTGSDALFKLCRRFIERMPKPDERVSRLNEVIKKKYLME